MCVTGFGYGPVYPQLKYGQGGGRWVTATTAGRLTGCCGEGELCLCQAGQAQEVTSSVRSLEKWRSGLGSVKPSSGRFGDRVVLLFTNGYKVPGWWELCGYPCVAQGDWISFMGNYFFSSPRWADLLCYGIFMMLQLNRCYILHLNPIKTEELLSMTSVCSVTAPQIQRVRCALTFPSKCHVWSGS